MQANGLLVSVISVLILLNPLIPGTFSQTRPTVVSTNPSDGATGVSPDTRSLSITFSKSMYTQRCGASTVNWPGAGLGEGRCTWSTDGKTMTLIRSDSAPALDAGVTVTVWLNPPGNPFLRDTEGNYLDPYTFSFKVYDPTFFEEIEADPGKGFHWPYLLYRPTNVKKPTVLLVVPNNTSYPSDDFAVHKSSAYWWSPLHKLWAANLGSPLLMPIFPRPMANAEVYTHALDRNALTTTVSGLVRLDLQLIAMIDDARTRLAATGVDAGPRVWMAGFSASGSFVNRFTILHPDRVQAVSSGAGGSYNIAPVPVWKGKTLPYPVGVADLQELVGRPFDLESFRKVPIQIYVGDVDFGDATDPQQGAALITELFGGPDMYLRLPASETVYRSVGSACQFVILPNKDHEWPDWAFMKEFFERNRAEPFPPPLPKPLLYSLYFPHIASFGPWETEIALTSTSEIAVNGELQAMTAEGNLLQTLPVAISAGGRVEFTVGKAFERPLDIAYITVRSDSGYLAGYTRFSQPGNRVSLPLSGGITEGYFTKVEQDGWTGIAFVNVAAEETNILLSAYDGSGNPLASRNLKLAAGHKHVGMVDQLFDGTDVTRMHYFKFSSDQKVAGFTVSASSDGLMLDGLRSLDGYIRQK